MLIHLVLLCFLVSDDLLMDSLGKSTTKPRASVVSFIPSVLKKMLEVKE